MAKKKSPIKKPAKKVNSRAKGARGERELAEFLRDRGYCARRGQQFSGSPDSPDVVCDIPGIHIECKRVETLRLYPALAQAAHDAGLKVPVVVHKANGKPWVVALALEDFLNLLLLVGHA